MKLKILSTNLFQTLHNESNFSYRIKGLLKKLNTLDAPKVILGFIIEFNLLLDQVTADIQRKNDAMLKLKPKEETRSWEWALANEYTCCIEKLEMSFKQDDAKISSCEANILKSEKEIDKL